MADLPFYYIFEEINIAHYIIDCKKVQNVIPAKPVPA